MNYAYSYSPEKLLYLQSELLRHPLKRPDTRAFMFDTDKIHLHIKLFDNEGLMWNALKNKAICIAIRIQSSDDVVDPQSKNPIYKTNELMFLTEYYGIILSKIYAMIEVIPGSEEQFFENIESLCFG